MDRGWAMVFDALKSVLVGIGLGTIIMLLLYAIDNRGQNAK